MATLQLDGGMAQCAITFCKVSLIYFLHDRAKRLQISSNCVRKSLIGAWRLVAIAIASYSILGSCGAWCFPHGINPSAAALEVDHVSCSNSGAWFVSFRDGQMPRWQCHHLPRRLNERILQLSGGDWKIQSLEFGFDGSWLLRFDARTPLESGC